MTQFTKLVVSDGCFTELQNNWDSNRVVNGSGLKTNFEKKKSSSIPYDLVTKKVYFVRIDPVDEVVTKWFF